jgi:hypothetical protein
LEGSDEESEEGERKERERAGEQGEEEEEGEEEGEEEKKGGNFVDFLAADACLALGKIATSSDLVEVAFRRGADIVELACERYLIYTTLLPYPLPFLLFSSPL